MACSFTNVFPIRFKHAALALRSKYKRGEAGLRHIPQDGGAQIRFTYHEFICAIKLCMQIYRTMNHIVQDMKESTTR